MSAASAKHNRQQNNAIMMMILINPPRIVRLISFSLLPPGLQGGGVLAGDAAERMSFRNVRAAGVT